MEKVNAPSKPANEIMNQFGRIVAPKDGRDFNYLARTVMPQIRATAAVPPKPRKQVYHLGPLLNQGNTPTCCEYAAKGFLEGAPIMTRVADRPAHGVIYDLAQNNDEWAGTNYNGTSVRGTMKALTILGHIKSYAWATIIEEVVHWTNGGFGTCVAGTNWYPEMSNVDRNGVMIGPASSLATPIGGHAWHLIWYDAKKKLFLMRNSWWTYFGIVDKHGVGTGLAYVQPELLARLMREDGEMACPTQIKVKPVVI